MPRVNSAHPSSNPLPPEQVRFLETRVEPWPDSLRVRIHITLTPFQHPPNLTAQIFDLENNLLSQADVISTMDDRFVFTMHIRTDQASGPFNLKLILAYDDIGEVDQRVVNFSLNDAQK
jgi:hypothetical protein